MLFGFSYLKLAIAGIALAGVLGLGWTVYNSIKTIGAQEAVIVSKDETITELKRQLKVERNLSRDSNARFESSEKRIKILRNQLASYSVRAQDCYRGDQLLEDIFILNPE